MVEDAITEDKFINYEIDENHYVSYKTETNNEVNSLYLTLFYYTTKNDLEVIIKEILGSKPAPLSHVELGRYVQGMTNLNQNIICFKDTIGGKDLDEVLYHELLHVLHPEQDEAWVREQTLKAGYSRFQYPIANYN